MRGRGERKRGSCLSPPSLPSSDENNMGAKVLNAAATQASRIMQNEEHRGKKKFIEIHLKRKVTSFLCFRCILRDG